MSRLKNRLRRLEERVDEATEGSDKLELWEENDTGLFECVDRPQLGALTRNQLSEHADSLRGPSGVPKVMAIYLNQPPDRVPLALPANGREST